MSSRRLPLHVQSHRRKPRRTVTRYQPQYRCQNVHTEDVREVGDRSQSAEHRGEGLRHERWCTGICGRLRDGAGLSVGGQVRHAYRWGRLVGDCRVDRLTVERRGFGDDPVLDVTGQRVDVRRLVGQVPLEFARAKASSVHIVGASTGGAGAVLANGANKVASTLLVTSTEVGDAVDGCAGDVGYGCVDVVSIAGNDVSSRGTTSLAMLWAAASRCCAARGGALTASLTALRVSVASGGSSSGAEGVAEARSIACHPG